MDHKTWIKRVQRRSDITTRLTHLTRSNNNMTAMDVLNKILEERIIRGSTTETGYIIGPDKAVCFQEVPLIGVAENIICENQLNAGTGIVRYEGFGIRVNKQHAYLRGARSVIYGKTKELKAILPESEWWRIVNHDLTDYEHAIDWTHEREWRVKGDYTITYSGIEVIVPNHIEYHNFINYWLDKNQNLLREINGIICLDSCIK